MVAEDGSLSVGTVVGQHKVGNHSRSRGLLEFVLENSKLLKKFFKSHPCLSYLEGNGRVKGAEDFSRETGHKTFQMIVELQGVDAVKQEVARDLLLVLLAAFENGEVLENLLVHGDLVVVSH